MFNDLINARIKGKIYAEQPERIKPTNESKTKINFAGNHSKHQLSYSHRHGWQCDCRFFQQFSSTSLLAFCPHTIATEIHISFNKILSTNPIPGGT